jgi:hypothetical protein
MTPDERAGLIAPRLLRVHEWMGNFDAPGIGNRPTGERAAMAAGRLAR